MSNINSNTHGTATAFLNMMKRLRCVILQDVATMILCGRSHYLFGLPVFQEPGFLEFKQKLCEKLESEKDQDPMKLQIDRVLPGLFSHINSVRMIYTKG